MIEIVREMNDVDFEKRVTELYQAGYRIAHLSTHLHHDPRLSKSASKKFWYVAIMVQPELVVDKTSVL